MHWGSFYLIQKFLQHTVHSLTEKKNAFRKLQHSFIPNKIKALAKIRLNIQTKLQGWQHKTLKSNYPIIMNNYKNTMYMNVFSYNKYPQYLTLKWFILSKEDTGFQTNCFMSCNCQFNQIHLLNRINVPCNFTINQKLTNKV